MKGNWYWRYTRFPLNHDYGRKGTLQKRNGWKRNKHRTKPPIFFISTCCFSGKWNSTRVPQYEHLIGTVELKFNKVTESYYGTHLQTHFRRKSSSSFQKQTLRNDFIDIYWIFPLNSRFASLSLKRCCGCARFVKKTACDDNKTQTSIHSVSMKVSTISTACSHGWRSTINPLWIWRILPLE